MSDHSSKAWFAPKRNGFGSSLPIAWQGWAAVVVFFVAIGIALAELTGALRFIAAAVIAVIFAVICSLKTEGGWRWRRGGR